MQKINFLKITLIVIAVLALSTNAALADIKIKELLRQPHEYTIKDCDFKELAEHLLKVEHTDAGAFVFSLRYKNNIAIDLTKPCPLIKAKKIITRYPSIQMNSGTGNDPGSTEYTFVLESHNIIQLHINNTSPGPMLGTKADFNFSVVLDLHSSKPQVKNRVEEIFKTDTLMFTGELNAVKFNLNSVSRRYSAIGRYLFPKRNTMEVADLKDVQEIIFEIELTSVELSNALAKPVPSETKTD